MPIGLLVDSLLVGIAIVLEDVFSVDGVDERLSSDAGHVGRSSCDFFDSCFSFPPNPPPTVVDLARTITYSFVGFKI
jgi:hypothetical protein